MIAAGLDFDTLTFSRDQWPAGVLEHLSTEVVLELNTIATCLPPACLTPSPVAGAHVRHTPSNSRHSTRYKSRLSDATDFFAPWDVAADVWAQVISNKALGGVGFYCDMMLRGRQNDYAMFHIDLRPSRVVWAAWRHAPGERIHYEYTKDARVRVLRERSGLPSGTDFEELGSWQ